MNSHSVTSPSRIAIEAVLKSATKPLTAFDIAKLTNLTLPVIRTHLGNGVHHGRLHNVNPEKRNHSAYLWGKAPSETRDVCRHIPEGTYDGAELRPYSGRTGAMDAYSLPSRGF
jgi:hypothetical protein